LLAVKPTKETCLNYNVSTINLALRRSNFSDVEPNRTSFLGEEPTLTSNEDDNDFIGNPCNTQQETPLYSTNEDEDAAFVFPEVAPTVVRKESIPYSVLVPLAKELASILHQGSQISGLYFIRWVFITYFRCFYIFLSNVWFIVIIYEPRNTFLARNGQCLIFRYL
jgi:hypothetical protein